MVPSGPSTPMGNGQPVIPSLLRSNSGILGGQGGPMPSQGAFPSLLSPRTQYNNVNLLGSVPRVPSILNQSFGNGVANPGFSGTANGQRGGMDMGMGAEPDPLSGVGAGVGFNSSPSSFGPTHMVNAVSSGQFQGQQFLNHSGNQMLTDEQPLHSQQLEPQTFQHLQQPMQQFSAPLSNQPQQQQFQSIRGGLGGAGPVKLESQVNNDQHVVQHQQQLQCLRGLGPVKLEPQLQTMRRLPTVKMEPQHSEHSMFLHQQQQQQQQQQQLLQLSRQSSQAAVAAQINLLQQQRLLQIQQQQQQQQLLKALPQQRSQMQQQLQAHNMPMRTAVKPAYEAGICARRVTQYMFQQQNRPEDNNIEFWRKFVAEFFAPNAKKKWCVSMYGNGRQTTGVFPQDAWHCERCNHKPGRGFEATVEVLPRLFKIKYESGTLEELLYVDMPREYLNPSGQIVLDYSKAIQESVFEQLRVVRDGQLRIVFSADLKICSWEFCARRHEELIPRRLLIPQVSQLGNAAQKYQAASQNTSSNLSVSDLQSNCNMFVASARQLAKALEVPLVNELGYTKRYVRCLQISEVVNSMKDLIDYSRITGTGPMESLAKFPREMNPSSSFQGQNQHSAGQQQQQQEPTQNSSAQAASMELATSNGVPSVNNSLNTSSASTSATTITGLHQNSLVSRPQNPVRTTTSPYPTSSMASPSFSSTMQPPPPVQPNPATTTSHTSTSNSLVNASMQQQQQPVLSVGEDRTDSQSLVQKITEEMMMSRQLSGPRGMMGVGSLARDMKSINGSSLNGPNCLVGNGVANNAMGGFGGMMNGVRVAMGNNPMAMNWQAGMASMARDQAMGQRQNQYQQQDLGNQLLSGLGAVNSFNNLRLDWKPSP